MKKHYVKWVVVVIAIAVEYALAVSQSGSENEQDMVLSLLEIENGAAVSAPQQPPLMVGLTLIHSAASTGAGCFIIPHSFPILYSLSSSMLRIKINFSLISTFVHFF